MPDKQPPAFSGWLQVVPKEAIDVSDERPIEELAHRTCSRYKHDDEPGCREYVFQRHTLEDFARAIMAPKPADHFQVFAHEIAMGAYSPEEAQQRARDLVASMALKPQQAARNRSARYVAVSKAALHMVRNALKNDVDRGLVVRGEILHELDKATLDMPIEQQAAQGEPVAVEYFAYHSEMGFEILKTRQEAIECCIANLAYERDGANSDGEWDESAAESVKWGIVVQSAKSVQTGVDDNGVACFDYRLESTTPPAPSVTAQEQAQAFLVRDVAELLNSTVPEVCATLLKLGFKPHSTNMQIGSDAALAVAAALKAQAQVPEGWKLVPIEPTPKMVDSTWNESLDTIESHNTRNKRIYRAMLSASPKPPEQAPQAVVQAVLDEREACAMVCMKLGNSQITIACAQAIRARSEKGGAVVSHSDANITALEKLHSSVATLGDLVMRLAWGSSTVSVHSPLFDRLRKSIVEAGNDIEALKAQSAPPKDQTP